MRIIDGDYRKHSIMLIQKDLVDGKESFPVFWVVSGAIPSERIVVQHCMISDMLGLSTLHQPLLSYGRCALLLRV